MKKLLLILAVLFLAGCVAVPAVAPQSAFGQGLIGLPDEARLLILSLLTAGVTWLLLQLSVVLKIDLAGYVQPIVAILAPIIVTFLENLLATIPPAFDNIVLTLIHLAVLLLGSLGGFVLFKRVREPKGLLAG